MLMNMIVSPFFSAGASGVITPAATALKSAMPIQTEGAATLVAPKKEQPSSQRTTEQIRAVNPVSIAPISAIPRPNVIRYVASTPFHYVAYVL